jgi:hypothetical protein
LPPIPQVDALFTSIISRGLYHGKYPRGREGGEYQPMSFGRKNMKRGREKGGKCKRKGRKGKENEKRGSKRVK